MHKPDVAKRITAALAVACMLSISCASPGTGDPIVVKAQDVLVNSLAVYDQAMDYHFKHSQSEPKVVYDAMEYGRKAIPQGWRLLQKAIDTYKLTRDSSAVDAAKASLSNDVEKLVVAMRGGS